MVEEEEGEGEAKEEEEEEEERGGSFGCSICCCNSITINR